MFRLGFNVPGGFLVLLLGSIGSSVLISACISSKDLTVSSPLSKAGMSSSMTIAKVATSSVEYDATKSFSITLPATYWFFPVSSTSTRSASGWLSYFKTTPSGGYLSTTQEQATHIAWTGTVLEKDLTSYRVSQDDLFGNLIVISPGAVGFPTSDRIWGWLPGRAYGLVYVSVENGMTFLRSRQISGQTVFFSWKFLPFSEEEASARKSATISAVVDVFDQDSLGPISGLSKDRFRLTMVMDHAPWDYNSDPTQLELLEVVSGTEVSSGSYRIVSRTRGAYSGERHLSVDIVSPKSEDTLKFLRLSP